MPDLAKNYVEYGATSLSDIQNPYSRLEIVSLAKLRVCSKC